MRRSGLRILPGALLGGQHDQVIAHDFALGLAQQALLDPEFHVVLGPAHPPDPAPGQFEQVREVHVGLVEQHDFTRADGGAQLTGVLVVVRTSRVDQHHAGQEALEVQAQVDLNPSLAAFVVRPVQTAGDELDRRGVDHVNELLDPARQAPVGAAAETFGQARQMLQCGPEQRLGHRAGADLVGMGQAIAAGRRTMSRAPSLA